MAIIIQHKFSSRLATFDDDAKISCLIIGTFNPGHPDEEKLNETERRQFDDIKKSKKYKDFQKIKNFYDRSKNRFWKVMDILDNAAFYGDDYEKINKDGLKFYMTKVSMSRETTFQRQLSFCKNSEIFITDLVKLIEPVSFCEIYDNFPDTVIEKSNPTWNTPDIKKMIKKYSIKKILVNFDFEGKRTPNLKSQIKNIRDDFSNISIIRIMSPSGSAGNSYSDLLADWKKNIEIKKPATEERIAASGTGC